MGVEELMTANLEQAIIDRLKDMARQARSVVSMFEELNNLLDKPHVLDIVAYFQAAFHLSLIEAKPLAALSRSERRTIIDEQRLESLVRLKIEKHRPEWDR